MLLEPKSTFSRRCVDEKQAFTREKQTRRRGNRKHLRAANRQYAVINGGESRAPVAFELPDRAIHRVADLETLEGAGFFEVGDVGWTVTAVKRESEGEEGAMWNDLHGACAA